MSIFNGDSPYNPSDWQLEKALRALQQSAKLIDLANEPDTTSWYSKKLKEIGAGIISRLAPLVAQLYAAGDVAASFEEWQGIKDRGSFALAAWCKKWNICDPNNLSNQIIRQSSENDNSSEKAEAPPEPSIAADSNEATDLRADIHHHMYLAMMNDQLPEAAKKILAWCCYQLSISRYADIIPLSLKFLPTDIGRSREETSLGYRALYEAGIIERVDSIPHSKDKIPIRLVVEGLNESKHPAAYRDEMFGFDGARINGEPTFQNSQVIKLPEIFVKALKWKSSGACVLADLREFLQKHVGQQVAFIGECSWAEDTTYSANFSPSILVTYRIPISKLSDTFEAGELEQHLNTLSCDWLRKQTMHRSDMARFQLPATD